MKRRAFIKQSSRASAAMVLPKSAMGALGKSKKITILHTNDQHSRIEPFGPLDTRNANKGGFARRAKLVEHIRKQEKNVLLLDSGDIFQGTPYFNFFGGEVEFKLMSYLKYDASTIGNHDFDNGVEGLFSQLPHAQFDFVISNYDFKNTVMDGFTKPYTILKKEGLKIGIFGLGIELEGLVSASLYKETTYLNPIEIAQEMTQQLKNKKCDFIICLSHLGYRYKEEDKISDVLLAQQTAGIDLILGGHTHTFLPEPQWYQNKEGKNVLINQVGFAGLLLGRIDVTFDPWKEEKHYAFHNVPIDESCESLANHYT